MQVFILIMDPLLEIIFKSRSLLPPRGLGLPFCPIPSPDPLVRIPSSPAVWLQFCRFLFFTHRFRLSSLFLLNVAVGVYFCCRVFSQFEYDEALNMGSIYYPIWNTFSCILIEPFFFIPVTSSLSFCLSAPPLLALWWSPSWWGHNDALKTLIFRSSCCPSGGSCGCV